MRLQQGQLWNTGDTYLRIVRWERLLIEYKAMPSADSTEGTLHQVSKKEFCRLVKHATLIAPSPSPDPPTGHNE